VHVYVDRATRRPVSALPDALRAALEPLVVAKAVADPSRG
jgi:acyl-CoA thioester hydrolase